MDDLSRYRKVLALATLCFVVVCVLAAALSPDVRSIALGLALGGAIGCINVTYLGYKVRQVADTMAGEGKRRVSLGFLTRAALSLLGVMVAFKAPQVFNMIAVAGGLLLAPILLIIIGIGFSRRER
ncbi:ATP synthase subunit I [Paenibacillus pedocola]|uniref:ATP synthase subunit I n=1 Tax=Paenibacillus pedocola TaxID=3242193 RepID=UPI0028779964|nr:ATP synthase subunit I [Paenibacillus typhae]